MIERRAFPGDTDAVPEARHYVVARLPTIPDERRQEVALMVSELATNCVRHAATGFTVSVQIDDRALRVEVTDHGTGTPRVKSPEPTEVSGRGLRIVQDLADSFGIRDERGGSTVWFVVRLDDVPSSDATRLVGATSAEDTPTSPIGRGRGGGRSTRRARPRRRGREPGQPSARRRRCSTTPRSCHRARALSPVPPRRR